MKRVFLLLLALLLLSGCGAEASYQHISQQDAKKMMDTQDVIVLDVREQDEFDAAHIPGAVLLPVGSITAETAAAV